MKNLLLLFIILFIVPFVYSQTQWETQIQPVCPGNVCLEGNPVVWRMQISNVGDINLQFQQISLKDDMNLIFALRNFKQNEFEIPKGKSQIIDIKGVIPAPSKGSLVYFKINYMIDGKVYNDNIRASKIMPLSEVECLNHDYCPSDKLCVGYRCVPANLINTTNISRYIPPKNNSINFTDIMLIIIAIMLGLIFVKINNKK